ncbi:MAG: alanine--tRNA ligase [Armatimonadetes bacterium]|nr:alanine--tRNA ligase [Armatimonadota bacterium]
MTVRELRQKYLGFFESKGHTPFPSGSLVPVDVTGRLDESLLFNGAGMVQFKPYFRGIAEPPNKRLATAQKCLRTGDIDEVGDLSHLTFFEMMGNFSFGDYFKQGAIDLSWEFITSPQWLALDPVRLSVTVFEEDDEAFACWSRHFGSVGIDPATRVFRLGEETNYWPAGAFSSGPPGPCGPNTEMFYWVSDDPVPPTVVSADGTGYSREDWIRDDAEKRWLEFWNDVFIQYEWQGLPVPEGGYTKTGMPDLPFQSVDTGMGLERSAAVLGLKSSVYDTDVFRPLFRAIASCGRGTAYGSDETTDRAMRIIADHLRAASFCIADGILPSNTGRGYVLRRLIRRAVLKGQRVLGFDELFAHKVLDGIIDAMGDHYQELHFRRDVIAETLKNEESQFRRTLQAGSEILATHLRDWDEGSKRPGETLDGEVVFRLYDTYGFPLEVTQEICAEKGVAVDMAGYKRALAEAQERSRAADERETVYGGVVQLFVFETDDGKPTPTAFRGYETTSAKSLIVGALPDVDEDGVATGPVVIALDESPFYAESGGQVSDTGTLSVLSPGAGSSVLRVVDVTKQDGVIVHLVEPDAPLGHEGKPQSEAAQVLQEQLFRQAVDAEVDADRRRAVTRNHTATHLLHAALRQVLGGHVTQAGSLVGPDHLRFDFTHGKAMTPEETARVERIVNEEVLKAQPVTVYTDVPIDEARKMGAMALFGEKYGEHVRVVQIGGMGPSEPSWSRELCGGIHVRNTGEIGLFKILHEASAASGVRRIEAVTGLGAYDWALGQEALLGEAAERLKSNPKEIVGAIDRTLDSLREERKKRERLAQQGTGGQQSSEQIGPVTLVVEKLRDADPKDAQARADRIVEQGPDRVALIANATDGKLLFAVKCGEAAVKSGAHAGNIVKAVATAAGGGGGGRPDFATAGGKNPAGLDAALSAGRDTLVGQVSGPGGAS